MVRITDIIGEDYRDWGRPKASIVYSATDTGDANHSQTEDPLANNTPETQRRKLKNAYNIIINAPTGSGKTYFILNKLLPYAIQHNHTIVYFTNRTTLKKQIEQEVDNKSKCENIDYHENIR